MIEKLFGKPWLVIMFFSILLAPALLINLDVHPLLNDESIRAVVTMEMIFSDDYFTPTIAGEIYLKKPPVYNWFIALFFKIFSNYNELTFRLVAVVSLILYSLIIFLMTRKWIGRGNAFLSALMFITCGRILFYDSFYGLIDIAFSALEYLSLMTIFYLYQKKKFLALFLITYSLCGITFLMKGLPSIYFQAVSLLAWFIYKKNFMRLISLSHLAGILMFILIIGTYYWVYLMKNPGTFSDIVHTLVSESTQKTALGVSLIKTLKHFLTFPFEFIFHFVPWTVFTLYLFRKRSWELIRKNEFMIFNLLLFVVNIIIFWFSADTYARFLFIHASLIFPVLLLMHEDNQNEESIYSGIVTGLFMITGCVLVFLSIGFAVSPMTNFVTMPVIKSIIISFGIMFFLYMVWKHRNLKLYMFIALLLVFRIGFNWFVLPSREKSDKASLCRDRAIEIAHKYEPDHLQFINHTKLPVHTIYYLTKEWKKPVKAVDKPYTDGYYIIYAPEFTGSNYIRIEDFPTTEMDKTFSIVKFQN